MSCFKGTCISLTHRTHAQVWDLSYQSYKSKGDFLVGNFVSILPYVVILEKRNIQVEEVHDVWKRWNAEK